MHFFILPFLFLWVLPEIFHVFKRGRYGQSPNYDGDDRWYHDTDPSFRSSKGTEPGHIRGKAYIKTSNAILQNKVFKFADANNGRVTLSDAVIETNLPLKQAEEFMNDLVDDTHVTVHVDENRSYVLSVSGIGK